MLERIEKLETKTDRIEAILLRLEPKITELLLTCAKQSDLTAVRLEVGEIKATSAKQSELNIVRVEIAEIKGRITNLPSTWTLISFAIGSCLASAGFAFAVARFFKP